MAKPIPCSQCDTGADSSWLLTARDDSTGLEPGTTLGFCGPCWVTAIVDWAVAFASAEGLPAPGADDEAGAGSPDDGGTSTPPPVGEPAAGTDDDEATGAAPKSGNGHGPPKPARPERTKAVASAPAADD